MLLDTDILWLSGAPPTKTTKTADELTMTFVIEKVMSQPGYLPDPANDIQVDLHFDRFDDEFKLRRVRMDPKLTTLMNPDFFDKECHQLSRAGNMRHRPELCFNQDGDGYPRTGTEDAAEPAGNPGVTGRAIRAN